MRTNRKDRINDNRLIKSICSRWYNKNFFDKYQIGGIKTVINYLFSTDEILKELEEDLKNYTFVYENYKQLNWRVKDKSLISKVMKRITDCYNKYKKQVNKNINDYQTLNNLYNAFSKEILIIIGCPVRKALSSYWMLLQKY